MNKNHTKSFIGNFMKIMKNKYSFNRQANIGNDVKFSTIVDRTIPFVQCIPNVE